MSLSTTQKNLINNTRKIVNDLRVALVECKKNGVQISFNIDVDKNVVDKFDVMSTVEMHEYDDTIARAKS